MALPSDAPRDLRLSGRTAGLETITVELTSHLRELLENEAARVGADVPQYMLEAALARAVAGAMLSDAPRFERLAEAVRGALATASADDDRPHAVFVVETLTHLTET